MGCINTKPAKKVGGEEDQAMTILPVFRLDVPVTASVINNNSTSINSVNTSQENEKNSGNSGRVVTRQKGCKANAKFDAKVTGKYDFKQLIGKGRYSRVWQVENRLTKQPYAMKIATGKEGKEIYQSELAVLNRVRHPYVIQLIETFETAERFYMVLQLATGGDLFDRVVCQPHGYFAENDAARILTMVLDGVRYLHRLGITHRDLKPDNLLFYHPGHDSKILITDFVIANIRKCGGGNDFMSTGCGTPEYIAPEVLSKTPYTSSVDLWALGVVTYIVLSGSFPFVDDPSANRPNIKLYKMILKGAYSYEDKVWEGVSSAAKDFISRLLVVTPEQRMSAAEALEHQWIQKHLVVANGTDKHNLESSQSCNSDDSSSSLNSFSSPSKHPKSNSRTSRDPELSILKQCILVHHSPFVS